MGEEVYTEFGGEI